MGEGPVVFLVSHATSGGVQELWSDLADGFRSAGHDVRQVALYPLHERDSMESAARWTYIVPKRPASIVAVIRLLLTLARFFRRVQPAMVFSAMPAANVAAPLAATMSLRRIPVSTSHHSPSTTYNRVLNFADGITGSLTRTHAVVCVGQTVARSLDSKPGFYRNKLRIIPNALSPHVEQSLAQLYRARRAQSKGARRVIAVGRLSEEKNYMTLIRCAEHLHNVDIFIVGGGPDEARLKAETVRLGVGDKVHFLGALPRSATLDIVQSGDVFVQPSLFEGHSLALIEAAKLGLPLVVSNAPSQIEAVSRDGKLCGIVVGLHDHVAWANTLQRLMDDADHRQHWAHQAYMLGETSSFSKMLHAYRALVPS